MSEKCSGKVSLIFSNSAMNDTDEEHFEIAVFLLASEALMSHIHRHNNYSNNYQIFIIIIITKISSNKSCVERVFKNENSHINCSFVMWRTQLIYTFRHFII